MRAQPRRQVLAIATGTASLTLAVVGGSLPPPVGGDVAEAKEAKIVQWDWFDKSAKGGGPWWSYVEDYLQKNWGVKLELSSAWNESKVPIAILSGERIDGIQIPYHQARNWTDAGLLYPITNYMRQDRNMRLNQFIPHAFDPVTKDGEIYALPWISDFDILLINVDMWHEAGLDTSITETWNWADFVTVTKKLTKQDGDKITRTGYAAWINRWTWMTWLYANGGKFLNESETAAAFNNPVGLETLNYLRELLQVYRVMNPGFEGEQNFAAGRSGIVHSGPWIEAFMEFPMQIDFAMFPKGPSASRQATVYWINYRAIPKTTADPDLAWRYLSWYHQQRAFKYKLIGTHRSPWIPFYQSPEWRESLNQFPHRRHWPDFLQMAFLRPVKNEQVWSNEVNRLITDAIFGRRSPTDALGQAERIVNAALQAPPQAPAPAR